MIKSLKVEGRGRIRELARDETMLIQDNLPISNYLFTSQSLFCHSGGIFTGFRD